MFLKYNQNNKIRYAYAGLHVLLTLQNHLDGPKVLYWRTCSYLLEYLDGHCLVSSAKVVPTDTGIVKHPWMCAKCYNYYTKCTLDVITFMLRYLVVFLHHHELPPMDRRRFYGSHQPRVLIIRIYVSQDPNRDSKLWHPTLHQNYGISRPHPLMQHALPSV